MRHVFATDRPMEAARLADNDLSVVLPAPPAGQRRPGLLKLCLPAPSARQVWGRARVCQVQQARSKQLTLNAIPSKCNLIVAQNSQDAMLLAQTLYSFTLAQHA